MGDSLPTRPCTEADFNSTDDSRNHSKFFKLREKDNWAIKYFGGNIKCLESPEELSIRGDHDSVGDQKNLQIIFKRCQNETSSVVCKSE